MREVNRILEQYDRALHGGAWHGDSVWEILAKVPSEAAFQRLSPGSHTIWELVSHMTFWETAVYRRLKKLPPRIRSRIELSSHARAKCRALGTGLGAVPAIEREFRQTVAELKESQLDHPCLRRRYTVYVEVHGVIQHNLYHAGQIALLARILRD